MVAISFTGETRRGAFYKLILSGEKKQTIRDPRIRPVKKGNHLTLYWKQRLPINKKPIHLIGNAICTGVDRVKKKDLLTSKMAYADGFNTLSEMIDWFGADDLDKEFEVIHFQLER